MVRQGGDRLADGGEALGLDHRLVVERVLDGEGGLVGDGDGQAEVVLGELTGRAAAGDHQPGGIDGEGQQEEDHVEREESRHQRKIRS